MNEQRDQLSIMRGAMRLIIDNLEDGDSNSAMTIAKFALVNDIAFGKPQQENHDE